MSCCIHGFLIPRFGRGCGGGGECERGGGFFGGGGGNGIVCYIGICFIVYMLLMEESPLG